MKSSPKCHCRGKDAQSGVDLPAGNGRSYSHVGKLLCLITLDLTGVETLGLENMVKENPCPGPFLAVDERRPLF